MTDNYDQNHQRRTGPSATAPDDKAASSPGVAPDPSPEPSFGPASHPEPDDPANPSQEGRGGTVRLEHFADVLALCPAPYRDELAAPILLRDTGRACYEAEVLMHVRALGTMVAHEWTIVRDIGVMTAEIEGYRLIKAQLAQEGRRDSLRDYLKGRLSPGPDLHRQATQMANGYWVGDAKARKVVDEILADDGLNALMFEASAYERKSCVDLDRTLNAVENRRRRLVRDLYMGRKFAAPERSAPENTGSEDPPYSTRRKRGER